MLELSDIAAAEYNEKTITAFASALSDDIIFNLAERYDSLIGAPTAKKQGSFYTPRALVQLMVQQALDEFSERPRSIADISCGSGVFLLEGLRQLRVRFSLSLLDSITSLYGVDRDKAAVNAAQLLLTAYATRLGLSAKIGIEIISHNLRVGNALIAPEELQERKDSQQNLLQAFSWSREFPQVFESTGGFDLIIGNPPYGLSRSDRISIEETEILRSFYLGKYGGKINSYILFILRAYSLLSPKGVLSFVVPNAWLGIDEARKIRKLLIDSALLTRIDSFETSPFKKLGVEVITFILKKGCSKDTLEIRTLQSIESPLVVSSAPIRLADIAKDSSYRISLKSNSRRIALIQRIESAGSPIKNQLSDFKASVGLQAYSKGRGEPPQTAEIVAGHPFHSTQQRSEHSMRYLEGKDLSPFKITWRGQFLEYGLWLAECPPLSHYQLPRIAIREILGPFPRLFQAAVTTEDYVYNRSILHIRPLNQFAKCRLYALAVILNSSLAGFWLWQRGRKAQRKLFPKIVTHDLNDFPIPPISDAAIETLNRLYQEMSLAQSKKDSVNEIISFYQSIDAEVASLYGVDLKEIEAEIRG